MSEYLNVEGKILLALYEHSLKSEEAIGINKDTLINAASKDGIKLEETSKALSLLQAKRLIKYSPSVVFREGSVIETNLPNYLSLTDSGKYAAAQIKKFVNNFKK
ncbi:MAG TPA: hypothetical protein VJJ76_02790 [archaeon]|nr:hypothetical protein [archaeon]